MSGTRYSARPALRRRDNEFLGDMAAWRREEQSDNSERLERLRRNLRKARRQELTDRQAPVLAIYYHEGLSVTAIARELELCKSTVSRTLRRGRERLKRYLQYSL